MSVVFAAVFVLSSNSASADAMQRIDLAARQVMLSMRMAMSLCLVDADVNENYQFSAQQAIQVFNGSLHQLINGQGNIIARAETNRNVLAALGRVNEMWFHLGPHYWQMSAERAPSDDVSDMIDDNILLMQLSNQALAEIQAAYVGTASVPPVAAVLLQVGRLRVLSQKATKEACFASQLFRPDEMRINLGQTLGEIQQMLPQMQATIAAMPADAETKAEIDTAVQAMLGIWSQMQALLMQAYENGGADKAQLDQLGNLSSGFLGAADQVLVPVFKTMATQ